MQLTERKGIGFSLPIRLHWLETAACLVGEGRSPREVRADLQELLRDQLSVGGTAARGTREKAITILLNIWVTPPPTLVGLRDDGLALLQRLPVENHLALHWGISMAVYPFFETVARTVGRLLRLQGTASALEVQRRLREELGERSTVFEAARRLLRSFRDWGVLRNSSEKAVYEAAAMRPVTDLKLTAWLIEAALIASGSQSRPLRALVDSPALFPFSLQTAAVISAGLNGRLELFRQGRDEDIVSLRTRAASRPTT